VPSTSNRTAGVAAIAFAVSIVTTNVVLVPAGLPRTGSALAEVTAFFASGRGAVGTATALGPIAWLAAVLFGAGVVTAVRRRGPEDAATWALAGFGGVLLQNATFTIVVALRLALASTGGNGADVLWPLHDALFTLNGTFLALALTGLTIAGRSAGLLRPWHAAIGMAAAASLLTSAVLAQRVVAHGGPLGLLGLVGWLLWVVWLVAYGIVLIRAGDAPADARPTSSTHDAAARHGAP
jgi:hypothetical protein